MEFSASINRTCALMEWLYTEGDLANGVISRVVAQWFVLCNDKAANNNVSFCSCIHYRAPCRAISMNLELWCSTYASSNCVVTRVAGWFKMFTQLQGSQVGRLLYFEYLQSQQYREGYVARAQWSGGQSICYCKFVHVGQDKVQFCLEVIKLVQMTGRRNTVQYSLILLCN